MTYLVNADTSEVVPLVTAVAPDHIILISGLTEAV